MSASAAAPAQDPAAPAAQVAQAATTLLTAASTPDGARTLSLRLHPDTLGAVAIRVEQPDDAPARVQISVERPQTLALLERDRRDLSAALDQAGIPAGRELVLHLASPDPPVPVPAPSFAPAANHTAAPQPDTASQPGAGGQSGNPGAGQNGGQGGGASGRGAPARADDGTPAVRPRTPSRAGLDITA